jgi:hypothetical protein
MKRQIAERLDALRQDFAQIAGRPFNHFFCPFLFVDEEAELCKAHVVNAAFTGSSRRWTLQRKDVDNFFGSMIESAFVDLRLDGGSIAVRALTEPGLHHRLGPKVLLNGVEVEHFVAKGSVPSQFAELQIEHALGTARLGLKMPKEQLASVNQDSDWQFEVSRDLRVPALVSVLKAAHLTMFELLRYRYALGWGGAWLGQALGSFYLENAGKAKNGVLEKAAVHFGPLTAMVRPVEVAPRAFTGSVDDKWVQFCWCDDATDRTPWGILTYVRTGDKLHAVLLPAFGHQPGADRFARFLAAQGDSFEVSVARFEGTLWTVEKTRRSVVWPAASLTG